MIYPTTPINASREAIVYSLPTETQESAPDCSSPKSTLRRFQSENAIPCYPSYLDLEHEADALLATPDDSFYSSAARHEHIRNVSEKYTEAASLAEKMGAYEDAASLHIKAARALFEKKSTSEHLAIHQLEQTAFAYQTLNQPIALQKLSDQILSFYDSLYNNTLGKQSIQTEELDEDETRWDYSQSLGGYKLDKASFCERLGILPDLRSQWYKEAGDHLMQNASSGYGRSGLSNAFVAALCYEKSGAPASDLQDMYKKELHSMLSSYQDLLPHIDTLFAVASEYIQHPELDYLEDSIFGLICMAIQHWNYIQSMQFASFKANDPEEFFRLSLKDLQFHESAEVLLQQSSSLEECEDSDENIINILYCVSTNHLSSYYASIDAEKADFFRNKMLSRPPLSQDTRSSHTVEGVQENLRLLYAPSQDRSVRETLALFDAFPKL